jgi:hypothetical protein
MALLIFAFLGAFFGVLIAGYLVARIIRSVIWSRYPVQTISDGDQIVLLTPGSRYPTTFEVRKVCVMFDRDKPAVAQIELRQQDLLSTLLDAEKVASRLTETSRQLTKEISS